jgi:4-amino-4-deoxy-L-arabinose transferase-like glycosyltransferase
VTSSKQQSRVAYLLVALAVVYFGVMATRHIALPGLYYDEVLFANAAFGGGYDGYVAKRILGVPVMLRSYLGALKGFLYMPIFALFGGSPASIRLPTICLSVLSLGLAFKVARLTFRPIYSALLVVLMAVDPSFIFMSKLDQGPIVLMMFFKLIALYCFLQALRTSSSRYLWGLAAASGLGLYDKLDFIWFVLALTIAAVLVFKDDLALIAARGRARFAWPIGTCLVLFLGSGLYAFPLLRQTQTSDLGLVDRLALVLQLYARTMDGREFYGWFIRQPLSVATITNWVTVAVIGMIVVAGPWRLARSKQLPPLGIADRAVTFYLLVFVLIFAQILVTRAADSHHHIMMLYPFHHVLLIGAADLAAGGLR